MPGKSYDVVVIGCGPGGAVAGRFAAANGAKTLIVERKRQIGLPVHDHIAIVYSWSDIERMVNIKLDTGPIISRAEEIVYFSPSGRRGKGLPLPDSFFINRGLADRSLTIDAVNAGAEVMVGARVIDMVKEKGRVKGVVIKSGEETLTIDCPVVIGAAGPNPKVARMAGLPAPPTTGGGGAVGYDFVGVKYLDPGPSCYEVYLHQYSRLFAMGGLVVRHGGGRVLFGAGGIPSPGTKPIPVNEALKDFKQYLKEIGRYDFDGASAISMHSGTSAGGLFQEKHHKIVSDGVMLIGDCAGKPPVGSKYGTPGMFNAMFTGRLAAEAAAAALKAGDFSEAKLTREYMDRVDETSRAERPRIMESRNVAEALTTLNTEQVERVIMDIGQELIALRLYDRGAIPLAGCLKPIQDWLRKEGKWDA